MIKIRLGGLTKDSVERGVPGLTKRLSNWTFVKAEMVCLV
jgi:hypothetical protein